MGEKQRCEVFPLDLALGRENVPAAVVGRGAVNLLI